ncbi:MAG: cation-translocating P-type ATPase [Thermoleophilia bacterium]|nr:cation-translocating P-type ATPase [Thermoleophilia bacterium]
MSSGLTEAEASRRIAARGEPGESRTSRSTATIVRANAITPFNAILLALGLLTLVFGDWRDALFLAIILTNTGIGVWQELHARRKLDELAALVQPHALVVRDGASRSLHVTEIVVGDHVLLAPGDQVVADGALVSSTDLLVDESILTGEAKAVARRVGDEVRSGSFVVEGTGSFDVAAVGADSYAERIAGTAREFRHPRSPLERAIDRLLYVLLGVTVPLGAMLIVALWKQDVAVNHAVETAVAGMVTLIPEGLVLLVSITYAAAAVRMARAGALSQQLNAIESLASVDTLCIDKTGTLTEPSLRLVALVPATGVTQDELGVALGRFAASSEGRNATLEAMAAAWPADPEPTDDVVPFLSRRRWSGMRLGGVRYVLGAPEVFTLGELDALARDHQRAGRRVVGFGVTHKAFPDDAGTLGGVRPLGLAVLAEELRPATRETIAFLNEQGVEIVVLSGDSASTVASIAGDAGIPERGPPLAGDDLPDDDLELDRMAAEIGIVGRISPEGKRRVVESLRRRGRYVAMVGDGVNDVPALKASRLSIAQGSGTQMAKAVSDVVLVTGDFAAVPAMVAEGRRVLRNIQRVTKLFVTKSVFAAFLIVAIGITPAEYPLLPRHLTIVGTLTVGIPAFFLALAPSDGHWRTDGFLREVGRFSVPAGVAAGLGVTTTYLIALNVFDLGLLQSRTAATTALIIIGLYLVLVLEATSTRRARLVGTMCGLLFVAYLFVLILPGLRRFFELAIPNPASIVLIAVGCGITIGFLWLTDDRFIPLRSRSR